MTTANKIYFKLLINALPYILHAKCSLRMDIQVYILNCLITHWNKLFDTQAFSKRSHETKRAKINECPNFWNSKTLPDVESKVSAQNSHLKKSSWDDKGKTTFILTEKGIQLHELFKHEKCVALKFRVMDWWVSSNRSERLFQWELCISL